MYKIIRDTRHQTNETLTSRKTLKECIEIVESFMVDNKYKYKTFMTQGNYYGYRVTETPYDKTPFKFFYIVKTGDK